MKKKSVLKILQVFVIISLVPISTYGQCVSNANIYTFIYDGKTYEAVKENKTWEDASACAVERGGILIEIGDENEQNAVYNEVSTNASITIENTIAPDGGGASYVWIGANDITQEGTWIWDGNNDGSGEQFWQGNASGNPVNDLYNNWGIEPDNYSEQDAAGIGLTEWPLGSGTLGQPGQWNDIDHTNTLYFIIEYSTIIGIKENMKEPPIHVYPNPAHDILNIEISDKQVNKITLCNLIGREMISLTLNDRSKYSLNLSEYNNGLYFVKISLKNNNILCKKIVKVSK